MNEAEITRWTGTLTTGAEVLVRGGTSGKLYIGVVAGMHPQCIPVVVDNGKKARAFGRNGTEMFSQRPARISPMDSDTRAGLMKRRQAETLKRLLSDDLNVRLVAEPEITRLIRKVRDARRVHDTAQKASWTAFEHAYAEAEKRDGLLALPVEDFLADVYRRGVTVEYVPPGRLHISGRQPAPDVIAALQYREREMIRHFRDLEAQIDQSGLSGFSLMLGEDSVPMPEPFAPGNAVLPLARLVLAPHEPVAEDDGSDPFAD